VKSFLKICVLASALVSSGTLAAQEIEKTNNDLLFYYDSELFQWNYGIFGGLTLNFQNQNSWTGFGILKETMKNALLQYEDAGKKYRSYKNKNIAGNVLLWTGLAAVMAGAYVPALGDWKEGSGGARIGIGLSLGGLVSEIIGIVLLHTGQEDIFDAVNLYNRHKIRDYK
jgi:hypothetical protein